MVSGLKYKPLYLQLLVSFMTFIKIFIIVVNTFSKFNVSIQRKYLNIKIKLNIYKTKHSKN